MDLISREELLKSFQIQNILYRPNNLWNIVWIEELIKNAKSVKIPQWIPCSERLPDEECQLYWTTHEDGSIVLHSYTKENGFIFNWEVDDLELRKKQGQVIAWKKIAVPQPYKES